MGTCEKLVIEIFFLHCALHIGIIENYKLESVYVFLFLKTKYIIDTRRETFFGREGTR